MFQSLGGARATDDPEALRWDARDYRDAADLHFAGDEVGDLLRDVASKMEAAAVMIERDRRVAA